MSPGPVDTEMLANIANRMNSSASKKDFKILKADDVANAVISSLATPPNVLVSFFISLKMFLKKRVDIYIRLNIVHNDKLIIKT